MNRKISEIIDHNVPLKDHCSFQIGGSARYFAEPEDEQELSLLLQHLKANKLQPFFFGFGSNLLFPDDPAEEFCYISLKRLNRFNLEENSLTTYCGLPLSMLAIIGSLLDTDLYDFSYLLPGSIGAGIYINARYFDREISQIVTSVSYLDLDDPGEGIQTIRAADCQFGYKESLFQKRNWLIFSARFTIPAGALLPEQKHQQIREFLQDHTEELSTITDFKNSFKELLVRLSGDKLRTENNAKIEQQRNHYRHFDFPSAGSVFKNMRTLGKPVGQIIDELGLKGTASGDAMISPYHGNIIINRGRARAADVLDLIDRMSAAIEKNYGMRPEPEITIVK